MKAWQLGARCALGRLRERSVALSLGLGFAACLLAATSERAIAPTGAVDRALTRDVFGVLLPLVGYFAFSRALASNSASALLRPVTRHGVAGSRAWLGAAAVLMGAMAALGTMFAVATVIVTRTLDDPELAVDLARCAWIGALAGAGYGAWLLFGSSLGRAGGGRKWLLLLDLVVGSSGSALAPFCLRPHVENLLGGDALLGQSQFEATFLLIVSTLFAALAARERIAD